MPKKTPQEVPSNWKNTWNLCNDSTVAVSPAAFNLAINMLHLTLQYIVTETKVNANCEYQWY